MDSFCHDDDESKRSVMIRKLVEGYEATSQLKLLLLLNNPSASATHHNNNNEPSLSLHDLVAIVHRSFTDTLSLLTSVSSSSSSSSLVAANDPSSEDSGDGRKRSSPPTKKNGGRGCYKRRRNAQSWIIVSPNIDDDHTWRKYGQKDILDSKFPRSYYRCTRKNDQGCRASKQVQMTQENPEMYQITYIGIHTCKPTTPKAPHLVMDSNTSSFLVKNNLPPDSNNKPLNEQDQTIITSQIPIIIKQEDSEEDTPDDDVEDHKLDPTIWSELKDLEPMQAFHSYALEDEI